MRIFILADGLMYGADTGIIWDARNLLMAVMDAAAFEQVAPYVKKGE